MTTLLAIIGLIVILHFLSKGLTKLGTFLESLGEYMEDRYSSNVRIPYKKRERINILDEGEPEKEESDTEYKNKVQEEIEKLTGGSNA